LRQDQQLFQSLQTGLFGESSIRNAHGELLKNEKLADFSNKYDVSVPQLCIRYTLQLGLLPLPKTAHPAHMRNNAELDFVISDDDMELFTRMEKIKIMAMPISFLRTEKKINWMLATLSVQFGAIDVD
jgi:diketogulonate reductase-like aldo/keto reductase